MSVVKEVEIKLEMTQAKWKAFNALQPDIFAELTNKPPSRIVDIYLDTPMRDLFRRGAFLRIRDQSTIQLKYSPTKSTDRIECVEHSIDYTERDKQAPRFAQLFAGIGVPLVAQPKIWADLQLSRFVTVAKTRRAVHRGDLSYFRDELDGIGSFLEIEAHSEDGAVRLFEIMQDLGQENTRIGYVEMVVRREEPETFPLGVFR